ncbi:Acyl-CoA synthetase OS=Streptomyces microflavus OX=1919 GN=HUT09_01000 PE=4 SV=1 [Streptomyces microflavus]
MFLLPYLAVGAENTIPWTPDPGRIFDLVEDGLADSLFAPPTVWIGLSDQPDFATRDLTGLRKAYYEAVDGPPYPSLNGCAPACLTLAFYNCFAGGSRPAAPPSP